MIRYTRNERELSRGDIHNSATAAQAPVDTQCGSSDGAPGGEAHSRFVDEEGGVEVSLVAGGAGIRRERHR